MHLSKGHNNQRYVWENRAQTLRSSLRRSDCLVGIKHPRICQPLLSTHK